MISESKKGARAKQLFHIAFALAKSRGAPHVTARGHQYTAFFSGQLQIAECQIDSERVLDVAYCEEGKRKKVFSIRHCNGNALGIVTFKRGRWESELEKLSPNRPAPMLRLVP